MKNTKVDIVLGKGQVGTAIGEILGEAGRNVVWHDPQKGVVAPDGIEVEVMNVCIPYSENFVKQVKAYSYVFQPKLTIIHSTVKVGTTRLIDQKAVYSFVRGVHRENLAKQMTFHTKHVGCLDEKTLNQAISYLVDVGFTPDPYDNPEVVEFMKLWDTTYYGINIAATKMAKEMADSYGLNWSDIASMNKAYNDGWLVCGHPEWVRQELEPIPGPIGGHCVVPNVKILKETFSHKLLDAIEEAK